MHGGNLVGRAIHRLRVGLQRVSHHLTAPTERHPIERVSEPVELRDVSVVQSTVQNCASAWRPDSCRVGERARVLIAALDVRHRQARTLRRRELSVGHAPAWDGRSRSQFAILADSPTDAASRFIARLEDCTQRRGDVVLANLNSALSERCAASSESEAERCTDGSLRRSIRNSFSGASAIARTIESTLTTGSQRPREDALADGCLPVRPRASSRRLQARQRPQRSESELRRS